jgi:hypothetical protein
MTFSSLISGTIPHHNKYNTRPGGIDSVDKVIQHHWATQTLAGEKTLADPNRKASVNYLVYTDGTIKGQVPEEFRPWTSGGPAADNTAITIECQNSTGAPNYEISAAAEASIVRLLADIATRRPKFNGTINRSNYKGHREFAATACPGPYLFPRLGLIAGKAAVLLGGGTIPVDKPLPPVTPPPAPSGLVVDGQWGGATTRRLQEVLGTPVDGVISHQWKSSANENIYSAQFDKTKTGSTVARAMQSRLGVGADGLFGSDSVKALQRHYGTPVDGIISPTSTVVKAMQTALNAGTF